jgi:hypothetical protein
VHEDIPSARVANSDPEMPISRFIIEVIKTNNFDRSALALSRAKKTVFRIKESMIEIDVVTDSISKVLESISSNFLVVDIRKVQERKSVANPGILDIKNRMLECEILSRSERFWECHTALESVWLHADKEYKTFLQSIILFSSSQAKYQMSNTDAAASMYTRAHTMLSKSGKSNMVLTELKHDFYYPIYWRFNIPEEDRIKFYLRYLDVQ